MNMSHEAAGMEEQKFKSLIKSRNTKELSIIVVFALIVIVLSFASPYFMTVNNLTNILLQSSNIMLVAIGMTFIFISGNMDLSLGSIEALSSAVVSVVLVNMGMPLPIALLAAIAGGMLCGLVNGTLVAYFHFPPFIATLGMQSIARGLGLMVTGGVAVYGFPKSFSIIGKGKIWLIPVPVILFGILLVFAHIVLKHTKYGTNVFAVGSNEQAAGLSGINVKRIKLSVYVMSGIMAAIAGIVMTSRLNSGQATIGEYDVMDTVAAVAIGGTSMRGGVGSIRGTFIGVMIISTIKNGLNLLGVDAYVQQVAVGIIIIVAILIDQISKNELKR